MWGRRGDGHIIMVNEDDDDEMIITNPHSKNRISSLAKNGPSNPQWVQSTGGRIFVGREG